MDCEPSENTYNKSDLQTYCFTFDFFFFFFFWVGCFDRTQRDIFRQAATYDSGLDLKEYNEQSVNSYIGKCVEDATVVKTSKCHNNEKPWMCADVWLLLKARNGAFQSVAGQEETGQ